MYVCVCVNGTLLVMPPAKQQTQLQTLCEALKPTKWHHLIEWVSLLQNRLFVCVFVDLSAQMTAIAIN